MPTSRRPALSRDRLLAFDPGLYRLQTSSSAALVLATTIGVEYGYSRAVGSGAHATLVAVLLGTVVAFTGWTALSEPRALLKVRTAAFFPVATLAGMVPSAALAGHTDLRLSALVVLLFLTVFLRRYGPAFLFYGNLAWIGFVFAAFLQQTVREIPPLVAAVAVSAAWSLLLSLTVLRIRADRVLRRVQLSFGARARAVAGASADLLLTAPATERSLLRLRSKQLRLNEIALLIDGWAATAGALPGDWSAAALRRRTLQVHRVVDELVSSAAALSDQCAGSAAPAAERIARLLGRHDYETARRLAAQVGADAAAHHPPVLLRFARAALRFADFDAWERTPPSVEDVSGFTPATPLVLGGLPGSSAVARGVSAHSGWDRLRALPQTSRQAVQLAVGGTVAVVVGRLVSPGHYFWAVAGALLAFAGTATSAESVTRAANAVVGTAVGLGVGIGVVQVTQGHTAVLLAVIVLSLTLGLYLGTVSNAFTACFTSLAVVQLYSVLHQLSSHLLLVRLAETSLGATAGVLAALLVLPTNTRDTVRAARVRYFGAVAAGLRAGAATTAESGAPFGAPDGVDAQLRLLDLRTQQLALVATPLTRPSGRPVVWGNDMRLSRGRMALHTALSLQVHTVAAAMAHSEGDPAHPELTAVAELLADAADALGAAPPGVGEPIEAVAPLLEDAQRRLRPLPVGPQASGSVAVRALLSTERFLGQLARLPVAAGRTREGRTSPLRPTRVRTRVVRQDSPDDAHCS